MRTTHMHHRHSPLSRNATLGTPPTPHLDHKLGWKALSAVWQCADPALQTRRHHIGWTKTSSPQPLSRHNGHTLDQGCNHAEEYDTKCRAMVSIYAKLLR